jgi:hypothetical protein
MELQDGTIVEEDLSGLETMEDYKWPIKTMVEVNDNWEEWKE